MIIPFRKNYAETQFLTHIKKVSLIATALIISSYFIFDRPLAQYLENVSKPIYGFSAFLSNLIDPKVQYFIWPLVFFFIRLILRKPTTANRILLIALSIPLACLGSEILKGVIGRSRPDLFLSEGVYGFDPFTHRNSFLSFPSGHATAAGALMGAVSCFSPKRTYLFLLISFLVSLSRVVLEQHFLSDIFGGVFVGVLTAQGVYTLMKRENIPFLTKK